VTANAALFAKLSYDPDHLRAGGDHGARRQRAGRENGFAGASAAALIEHAKANAES
jgi:hypothetical protein